MCLIKPNNFIIKTLAVVIGLKATFILFLIFAVGLIFGPLYLMGGPGEIAYKLYNKGSKHWPASVQWADLNSVPAHLMPHFKAAGEQYGIPWWVLVAIAKIESDFRPNVTGPPNYTNELAQGMMQFLPSTWKAYGVDGDGDGRADINNPIDSIYSAANYLAANNGASDIEGALFIYNRSNAYVREVLAVAEGYQVQEVWRSSGKGFPLPTRNPVYTSFFGEPRGGRTHNGVDIACAHGTPLLAVTNGVIRHSYSHAGGKELWIETPDGIRYFYCHLSKYVAQPGETVVVGQTVGLAGTTGVSSGPHLHFGIMTRGGVWIDPLPFLEKVL